MARGASLPAEDIAMASVEHSYRVRIDGSVIHWELSVRPTTQGEMAQDLLSFLDMIELVVGAADSNESADCE